MASASSSTYLTGVDLRSDPSRGLGQSSSVPVLPAISPTSAQAAPPLFIRELRKPWTSERRRLLHQRRERQWLRSKAKHSYIDFSDTERAELRRYFDALAGGSDRIRIDKLENMLISLGLADTRREVAAIVERIDSDGSGELDFEEYLEIVRTRTDSNIFQVFKAMMEGKLGDRNLNFQTVISTYRRKLILDATGARNVQQVQQELGGRILHNFAALQRSRHAEAALDENEVAEGPSFDATGQAPLGGLEMMWRGVCHEHSLVSSRPASADGRSRRALERPPSPRSVVEGIVKASQARSGRKQKYGGAGGTVIVSAPALEESSNAAAVRRLSRTQSSG